MTARLVVVGGGIGGLATALALARSGRSVVVLERAEEFAEVGAGLQIAPNGLHALDRLGVGAQARDLAVRMSALRFRDGTTGETLATLRLGPRYVERFGHPYVVVHRGELHRALLDACRAHPGVDLLPHAEVVDVEQDGDGILVHLAGRARTLTGDVLVGADGVHSTVRARLIGEQPVERLGITVFRSVVPMSAVPVERCVPEVTWWTGPGCHLVHYPISGGTELNLAPSSETDDDELLAGAPVDDAITERLVALCVRAREVLALGRPWRAWSLVDCAPLPRWADGRVVLVGDAAHAMVHYLAQGACQALEDAVVLGEALDLGPDHSAAFARYFRARREQTRALQVLSRRSVALWHPAGAAARQPQRDAERALPGPAPRPRRLGPRSPGDRHPTRCRSRGADPCRTRGGLVSTREHRQVAVVGAGPRGLSVLERLCAHHRVADDPCPVTIHVVDPAAPGAGTVWRSEQPRHLLMNTVASQVTVFTDDSVACAGPIEHGPTLHDWARELVAAGDRAGGEADLLAEAAALGPDTYPTRAFYGRYLQHCFARVVAGAPEHVTVEVHASRAVALADTYGVLDGPQGIRLEDGTRLDELEAVVLAQGHVPSRPTLREARAASLARIHHLRYEPPANPADVDLTGLAPGETVLFRGLGLCFFDHLATLTIGRGGWFETADDGSYRYHPSGDEPRLVAFSRRGVPHQARGRNEKGPRGRHEPRLLTPAAVDRLRRRRAAGERIGFRTDLWPLIAREVEAVYYGVLVAREGGDREAFLDAYLAAPTGDDTERVLRGAGIVEHLRWDWQRLERPTAGARFRDREHFRAWLTDYLESDLTAARTGNLSDPVKSALDALRDLRNEIRLVVDHSGIDGDSYSIELQGWYTPLNAYLSIGPPAQRIGQMAALLRSGHLEVTGPGTLVRIDPHRHHYVADSTEIPGPQRASRTLVEARLPEPDVRRTTDPLLRHLLETAQCVPYAIPSRDGRSFESGGLAVGRRPYRLVGGDGAEHPRRFAFGVPTEAVHWVTAAGARPGVDSVSLADADAIARAVLELPGANPPRGAVCGLLGVAPGPAAVAPPEGVIV